MAIPSEQCFFLDLFSHILYFPDSEISVQPYDPAGTVSESVIGYDHLEAFPVLVAYISPSDHTWPLSTSC